MPASEARNVANRQNAQRSTGPKTPEGKLASRENSLKHGLTGAGVVLADEDRAEVERLAGAFRAEMGAPGNLGEILTRRMAVLAVRMERSGDQEIAAVAENVRRAEAGFEAPEGVTDEAEIARLRAQAGKRALFDPSPEAERARKYEAAAERGFFRALRELRQARDQARAAAEPAAEPAADRAVAEAAKQAAQDRASIAALGSFLPKAPAAPMPPAPAPPTPRTTAPIAHSPRSHAPHGVFDVPITIGRAG